jgi:hypothetical protein
LPGNDSTRFPGLTSTHSSVLSPAESLHAGAQIHQHAIGRINANPADTRVLQIEDDVHGKRKDRAGAPRTLEYQATSAFLGHAQPPSSGDVLSFEHWKGPKKLSVGPPLYLDRPVYQYHYESLRWFDYWLKGIDTGIMEEPAVQLFIQNTGEWKTAQEWPLPETKWTEFYLHEEGLLFEHELLPHETSTSFRDSKQEHGSVQFISPRMVENTEICGPMVLNLYASTTDVEALVRELLRSE